MEIKFYLTGDEVGIPPPKEVGEDVKRLLY